MTASEAIEDPWFDDLKVIEEGEEEEEDENTASNEAENE
jgi:hypothetical protein